MTSAEHNSEDWREIRARADSAANAVFLIAGGALSVSISLMLDGKADGVVTKEVARIAIFSWHALGSAVVLFLLLKAHLILQAFMRQFKPQWVDRHLALLNGIGWTVGLLGLVAFILGLWLTLHAAATAITASAGGT